MESPTPDQIRQLSPEAFMARLQALETAFTETSKLLALLSVEIGKMKKNCPHKRNEERPYAKFCRDCGEYYAVKTAFSPEVEDWFNGLKK